MNYEKIYIFLYETIKALMENILPLLQVREKYTHGKKKKKGEPL